MCLEVIATEFNDIYYPVHKIALEVPEVLSQSGKAYSLLLQTASLDLTGISYKR